MKKAYLFVTDHTVAAAPTANQPTDLERFTTEKIESGQNHSATEVIGDAPHLLRERDEQDPQEREDLRRDLAAGIEQADQGMLTPLNARETLARLRQTWATRGNGES